MEFRYRAKKGLDDIIEGTTEADSVEQVVGELERAGLIPVSIEEVKSSHSKKKKSVRLGKWGLGKVRLFTQKLYNLTKASVELLSALRILEEGSNDPTEKTLLQSMTRDLKEGVLFSESLNKYPQYFPSLYVNIIRTGEGSGQLKDALYQVLIYLQRIEDLRSKVRQALAYPIFMILVGVGTIFVMLTFILPRLASIFDDFEAALPLPTQILLRTSDLLQKYWVAIVVVLLCLITILKRKSKFFSRIKYHLPLVSRLIYKQSIANFSRSTALLLKSGVTLLSALGIVGPIIGNPARIKQLESVVRQIKDGDTFSHALRQYSIFPEFFVQMIRVGEEGGRLDSVLEDISEAYEQEIEADLKIISSLLEPAIILVLGLVIGAIVMAVLLPIFNINTLVAS